MTQAESNSTVKFLQGNEACVEAALAAGVRFFAGYPITPSTEIAEILSKKLPQVGGKFIQMEDEIASMGAVLGASLAGMKTLTATSGPGFSLKQELIGYAALCEVPCVIVNVQRGGPSTGSPMAPSQADVMQARWGTHGEHPVIVLAPASVKEMYDLTVFAVNLSESLRVPVIILSDEIISHMFAKIELPSPGSLTLLPRPEPRREPDGKYLPFATRTPQDVPGVANFGDGYRFNVTGLIHDVNGFPTGSPEKTGALLYRLHEKINSRMKEICLIDKQDTDADIILCSFGGSALSCAQAVEDAAAEGIRVGFIKLKTLWPFPDFAFDELTGKNQTVIVVEMNLGQVVREVARAAGGRFRVAGVNSVDGTMILPQTILKKIKETAHAG